MLKLKKKKMSLKPGKNIDPDLSFVKKNCSSLLLLIENILININKRINI